MTQEVAFGLEFRLPWGACSVPSPASLWPLAKQTRCGSFIASTTFTFSLLSAEPSIVPRSEAPDVRSSLLRGCGTIVHQIICFISLIILLIVRVFCFLGPFSAAAADWKLVHDDADEDYDLEYLSNVKLIN